MARLAFVAGAVVAFIAMGMLWLLLRKKKLDEEAQMLRKERDKLDLQLQALYRQVQDGPDGDRRQRVEAALKSAAGYAARDQIPDLDEIVRWRRVLEEKG